MAGNQENILVEFDYDNITLIDPNKVIDEFGNIKERVVKQEDLVIYANLECNVLPRTKLAVGSAMNDSQRTISVAKINFLNPGNKKFLTTSWTDELTGKDTLQGKGVNQPNLKAVKNPNDSNDYYITQNTLSNGQPGAVDNGLLGIKYIKISYNTNFLPTITIQLEDVKGRALFEGGNSSPYAAFFQLPYPQFTLTIKGYYGKAVKLPIMLQSFYSRFENNTGNYSVTLQFFGYKYTLLSYVNFANLMAVPHMYNNVVTQNTVTTEQGTNTNENTLQSPTIVSRGYQKMKEIYSDYKAKGLIPDDFPEITLNQLNYRLQLFIKNVLDSYAKENMGALTTMTEYTNNLIDYQKEVFTSVNSWFNKYMDVKNPTILKSGQKVYTFKKTLSDNQKKQDLTTELDSIIKKYNSKLNENGIFGTNGSYTVGNKTIKTQIPVNINLKTCQISGLTTNDIDTIKTFSSQENAPQGNLSPPNTPSSALTKTDLAYVTFLTNLRTTFNKAGETYYFFEGQKSFMDSTDQIGKDASKIRTQVEQQITENLATKFTQKGDKGLGFTPSIRNVLAIFYCQGEAFLRLMDEVHKKAWDQRENPYRRAAIFGNSSTAPSSDITSSTQNNEPIYPWPQVIQETTGDDGKEKFEMIYPGSQTVASSYRAYNPEIWPEVEFVEQFIKGFTQRQTDADSRGSESDQSDQQPLRLSLNAIDFPVSNEVFQNKEETKYFFEIYERLMLNSYYSLFNRPSGYNSAIYEVESGNEGTNILKSLGNDNPYLTKTIKEYLLDGTNYLPFLRHISNEGQGDSWQSFIRGEFTTPYIRNDVNNPSVLFNSDIFLSKKSQPSVSLVNNKDLVNLENYMTVSSSNNEFVFGDTYPIIDLNWDRNNLANGKSLNNANEAFDTKEVLEYNDIHKTITNFDIDDNDTTKRPITHFNYTNLNSTLDTSNLKTFYQNRQLKDQVITEGSLFYTNYSNYLTDNQTTSMLNTPYFINAIQKGVFNFRYKQNDPYPYKLAAYLFLNSLPLATLREKYVSKNGDSTTDLSYILSTFKKFGAVHKIPYAWILKYGSIWHRYKIYKETNVDILDEVWTDFNYKENWDPVNSATTLSYNLTIDGTQRNLVLDDTTGSQPFTDINTGFYPQLVDDFSVFLQGLKIFSGKTQVQGNVISKELTGTCSTYVVTGTCSTTGTGITINSISKNYVKVPDSIFIPQLNTNIQLVSQTSGISGGTGTYTTPLNFNAAFTNLNFVLGSFADITNNNSIPIQVGNILEGSLTTAVISVTGIFSASTSNTSIFEVSNISAETFNYTVLNPPIQVLDIDSNVLVSGSILNGLNLNGDIKILSQISGVTGGVGLYNISTVQPPTQSPFVVQGSYIQGIGSAQIQNLINNGKLVLLNTTNSTIFENQGFDTSNLQRSMRVSPWSTVIRQITDSNFYYVVPSFGSNINQAKDEAFKNGNMKVELSNNPSLFNGSVRLFWNIPQYGWFDNSKLKKNNPETYLKTILNEQKDQQNFLISGDDQDYTNFEELFTTFNTQTLDYFESEFLNYGRSVYDYVDTLPENKTYEIESTNNETNPDGTTSLESDKGFKNFHYFMRELLKVGVPTGSSPETKLESIIQSQNDNFQKLLTSFMNYDVAFKHGNPSNFDRRLFLTFSTRFIEDPIIYSRYEFGNLPPQVSLQGSQQQNPETWKALLFYVGESSIPELEYKNSGSYITDFFIDLNVQFNEKNVKDFAPLIKIYASEKLKDNSLDYKKFYSLMDNYFIQSDTYINNVINTMLPYVRKQLPNIIVTAADESNRAPLEAGYTEQTRTELWDTFKSLNDTWISGFDFNNKTLFEDVMLVDRASRDLGDKILVDIFEIQDLIQGGNYKNTLLDMITTILVQNNFQHFMLPSFVNFYNVQDTQKNPTPRPEGTLDFANTLFGTFLNVDYRESSPKFLCYYTNPGSQYPEMKDNPDFKYRDDAFDLRRASDNPLVENQTNKTDWDKSNKVVGFNIDFGRQNQQVFKSFNVAQDAGKPTSESLEMLNQMANSQRNRRTTTQSVSLYNVYKNRSYKCTIEMLGCALIQPMMYFNLRNVPMFSGPYMITSIQHDISQGEFNTTFDGTRQSIFALPKIDNFLQSLNVKILSTIQEKYEQREKQNKNKSENIKSQQENILANIKSQETLTKNQDCQENINPRYFNYTPIDTPQQTSLTTKELYNAIKDEIIARGGSLTGVTDATRAAIAFMYVYVDSGNQSGISGYENNYSTINLQEVYGDTFTNQINKKFFCISRGTKFNLPVASFISTADFVKFVLNRTINIVQLLNSDATTNNLDLSNDQDRATAFAKQYVLNYPINQPNDVYSSLTEQNKLELRQEFEVAWNKWSEVQTFQIT
jgi:hypothetical protein